MAKYKKLQYWHIRVYWPMQVLKNPPHDSNTIRFLVSRRLATANSGSSSWTRFTGTAATLLTSICSSFCCCRFCCRCRRFGTSTLVIAVFCRRHVGRSVRALVNKNRMIDQLLV